MKNRYTFLIVVILALVLSAIPMGTAHAYPPCDPFYFPSSSGFCRPYFITGNELVLVTDSVSSAAIRTAPSENAAVVLAVKPDTFLQLAGGDNRWGGQQWWWLVQRDAQTVGWIEQANIDGAQLTASHLPVPCIADSADVYLLIDGQRRLIPDWQTFLSLGYLSPDIQPCGNGATFPLGKSVTRLIKGSDAAVYRVENGARRHIPDMTTFTALGYHAADVSVLPDLVINLWPLGKPLASKAASQANQSSGSATAGATAAAPVQCVADYSGQIALAFANNTDGVIWISGLDANCNEFHMWSVVKHTQTILLTLPAKMSIIRIREDGSNKLLGQYTVSAAMNGSTISVP